LVIDQAHIESILSTVTDPEIPVITIQDLGIYQGFEIVDDQIIVLIERTTDPSFLSTEEKIVPCPQCDSKNTELISQFGSTACKALYKCKDCLEPFDYFKCY